MRTGKGMGNGMGTGIGRIRGKGRFSMLSRDGKGDGFTSCLVGGGSCVGEREGWDGGVASGGGGGGPMFVGGGGGGWMTRPGGVCDGLGSRNYARKLIFLVTIH